MSDHSQLSLCKMKTLVPFGDLCSLLPSSVTPHFIINQGIGAKRGTWLFSDMVFPLLWARLSNWRRMVMRRVALPSVYWLSWPIVWIQKQWTTQGILSVYPDNVLSLSWRDPVFCSSLHCCVSPAVSDNGHVIKTAGVFFFYHLSPLYDKVRSLVRNNIFWDAWPCIRKAVMMILAEAQ